MEKPMGVGCCGTRIKRALSILTAAALIAVGTAGAVFAEEDETTEEAVLLSEAAEDTGAELEPAMLEEENAAGSEEAIDAAEIEDMDTAEYSAFGGENSVVEVFSTVEISSEDDLSDYLADNSYYSLTSGTYKLTADVAVSYQIQVLGSAAVEIDLNGYTLTGASMTFASGQSGKMIYVTGGSSLTVFDDSTSGGGTITSDECNYIINSNYNTTLILKNITISNTCSTASAALNTSGTVTIENCTITSAKGYGIYVFAAGTTAANAGSLTITGDDTYIYGASACIRCNSAQSGGTTYVISLDGGTYDGDIVFYCYGDTDFGMEISGGTVTGSVSANYNSSNQNSSEQISITVSGGTIEGDVTADTGEIEITGGTVEGDVSATSGSIEITGGSFSGDVTSYLSSASDTKQIELIDGTYVVVTGGASGNVATAIDVGFEQAVDINGADIYGTYNIILTGTDSKVIYRFLAAELTFELSTGDDISYEIAAADGIELVEKDGVYEFSLTSDTATTYGGNYAITGYSVNIGTVTFAGVGTVASFGTATAGDMVQTAVFNSSDNNIVRTYTPSGTDELTCTVLTNAELSLDTTELTVYVMFPNSVEDKNSAYENMTVTYNNVSESGAVTVALGYDGADAVYETIDASNGWSGYVFTAEIPIGHRTSLEFAGAGYRTYRTAIVPTDKDAVTVTVWNNAMDGDTTVIADEDDSYGDGVFEKVTFLAGDIVTDYTINLYDLSAVTAYFGKTTRYADSPETDMLSYVSYDLNRDGKIDSKDIAMVLVSWDK